MGGREVAAELLVLGAQLGDFLVGQFQAASQRLIAGPAAGLPGWRGTGQATALHLPDLVTQSRLGINPCQPDLSDLEAYYQRGLRSLKGLLVTCPRMLGEPRGTIIVRHLFPPAALAPQFRRRMMSMARRIRRER